MDELKTLIKTLEHNKLNSEIKLNRLPQPVEMFGAKWQAVGYLVKAFFNKFEVKLNLGEKKMRASVYMFSDAEMAKIIRSLNSVSDYIEKLESFYPNKHHKILQ